MKPLVLEANTKVLAFVDMPLDPYYESSKLKDTTDGIYTDVFDGLSYERVRPAGRLPRSCWTRFLRSER